MLSRKNQEKEYVGFLVIGGTITAALMLDDLFMLHEYIYPDFLHISQNIVFCIYAMVILLYLVRFNALILKTDFPILILSLAFFTLSLAADILSEYHDLPWLVFFDDGAKFLGIVSWVGYFINLCFQTLIFVSPQQYGPGKAR
ncbi:MAG TPA: hypothetical protein VI749_00685 [Candidatus Omnitrophota bacterium]|nr:hypothetical protein [Candidatus Omnitrophota bacterium]